MKNLLIKLTANGIFFYCVYCWLALDMEAGRNIVVFTLWIFGFMGNRNNVWNP